jgi:hypothetical protein
MDEDIEEKLLHIFWNDTSGNWKKSEPVEDLDNYAGMEVEFIEPEDAKSVEEVKAFTVTEEVMGTISTTFRRKKIEEL